MAESTGKKRRRATTRKRTERIETTTDGRSKAAEYVGYLLELHKLEGALLAQLCKEV